MSLLGLEGKALWVLEQSTAMVCALGSFLGVTSKGLSGGSVKSELLRSARRTDSFSLVWEEKPSLCPIYISQ